jgi:sodium transport system permease protein
VTGRTSPAGVVFRKEFLDNLRDRRTLAAALLYPCIGPAMILMLVLAIGKLTRDAQEPLALPVSGVDHAPSLLAFLEQHDVEILEPPADPEAAVKAGEHDVVLIVPEDFAEAFRDSRPATVVVVQDDSNNASLQAIRRAEALLYAYSRQIGRLRLQLRGIDPGVVDALAVERVDVSTPQSQAARILSMAPYLIIISIFVGGMYLAIDSTAGERERGSLEPLLINPVSATQLVVGKASAVFVFTAIALLETLIGFAIVLNLVPLERYIGVPMTLSAASLLAIVALSIPLMVFAVAVQLVIASYTKSFKEAQNYISLMLLVPALPALFIAVFPVRDSLWISLLPTVGQQIVINQILRGSSADPVNIALGSMVTLLSALVLLGLVVRQYSTEDVLFR